MDIWTAKWCHHEQPEKQQGQQQEPSMAQPSVNT